jgi:hypothetical protein
MARPTATWIGLVLALAVSGCSAGIGACEGKNDILQIRYCQDAFSEDQCRDYDEMRVNGADWTFHDAETCTERGCPGGTC